MIAVANAGFRAIAPDYRGYGPSDIPREPEKTSFVDLVNDTASILDSLAISKAFVIGKDFGSLVGYLFHPQKVAGIITLGVPFMPPGSHHGYLSLPEGFYMRRWREVGRAEADFGRSLGDNSAYPQQGLNVEAPALLIMGKDDYLFKFPGMEE
ncbi:hypothetical protein L1987_28464 [Smallanthus sonchifolius]|uniref:Uncharacterized protein n=1 Tax=Smallanthus sonchifolius TaxID=185202 RepID=A0ACB9HXB8_9ASTR|nr:hypothetical protein L1987_28464 [Smallanthus sonchifolius]